MSKIQRCTDCHEPTGPAPLCETCAALRMEGMVPKSWVEEAFREAVELLGPCFTTADALWIDSESQKRVDAA